MPSIPRRLWQIAGTLALAHVALIPVGLWLQDGPLFSDGVDGITDSYLQGDLPQAFTGGILESFAFLLLVPAVAFLGRALGRGSELGRWAAQTGTLCGLAYVAVVFAVGFPAGGAAMYGVQHGLDVDAAFALNNLRIFGHFLSLLLLGGSTLGFAVAALASRVHPRWVGGFGAITGIALLASTPLASIGQQDWGGLVWMVWFVGVGVLMLRHHDSEPDVSDVASAGSLTREAPVGQS